MPPLPSGGTCPAPAATSVSAYFRFEAFYFAGCKFLAAPPLPTSPKHNDNEGALLHCCCCVTLSAVSAWSGLASTLGIKQKSVLSQVTSEDGSTCFAFKYACCSQFTNILTSSKIDIFPKSKEFVISVILRRWLMVVFISCILVSGGYSMCVCELEIRLLFMKTQECVKSRSIDGQMCSRC